MKDSKSTTLTNAYLVFDEDAIKVVEVTKDNEIERSLEDILMKYEGLEGLSITIKHEVKE